MPSVEDVEKLLADNVRSASLPVRVRTMAWASFGGEEGYQRVSRKKLCAGHVGLDPAIAGSKMISISLKKVIS